MNSIKYPNLRTKLGRVTTLYNGKTRYEAAHKGVDIANAVGTPIPTFTDGRVLGINPGHKPGENNYGNSILIKDKYGNTHRYSHLQKIGVRPGEEVKKDQVIGSMGETGSAYSPTSSTPGAASHLDYRIVDAFNKYVDPSKYIRKYT